MWQKYKEILGQKGMNIMKEYQLTRRSLSNKFGVGEGISIYSPNGELRFSDHWENHPHTDDIEKYLTEDNQNMILGLRQKDGTYDLLDIAKKEKLGIVEPDKKINPKSLTPDKLGKILIGTYKDWKNSGKLKKLPQLTREDFESLVERLHQSDNFGMNAFIEKYGTFFPSLSGFTNVA